MCMNMSIFESYAFVNNIDFRSISEVNEVRFENNLKGAGHSDLTFASLSYRKVM